PLTSPIVLLGGPKQKLCGITRGLESLSLKREVTRYLVAILVVVAFFEVLKVASGTDVPLAIVEGTSMVPVLHSGDIVLLVGAKPSDLKVGDIIVYKYGGKFIIHKIIHIEVKDGKYFFVTQGENNKAPDPYLVSEDQVVGRVFCVLIPRVGIILQEPFKYVVIGLLLLTFIALIIKPLKKREEDHAKVGKGFSG
ncbi:MAG: signal peptidase I, partial [Candidatus Nezhaarchaeales archaeon]